MGMGKKPNNVGYLLSTICFFFFTLFTAKQRSNIKTGLKLNLKTGLPSM